MIHAVFISIYQATALALIFFALTQTAKASITERAINDLCHRYTQNEISYETAQKLLDKNSESIGAYEITVDELCETETIINEVNKICLDIKKDRMSFGEGLEYYEYLTDKTERLDHFCGIQLSHEDIQLYY